MTPHRQTAVAAILAVSFTHDHGLHGPSIQSTIEDVYSATRVLISYPFLVTEYLSVERSHLNLILPYIYI